MNLKNLCYINGFDMWDFCKGLLQRGAYEELLTPTKLKSFIENKSRLQHGTQVLVKDPKIEERTLNLSVMISGENKEDCHLSLNSTKEKLGYLFPNSNRLFISFLIHILNMIITEKKLTIVKQAQWAFLLFTTSPLQYNLYYEQQNEIQPKSDDLHHTYY